ncbi:MAG: R3H domain-containing nucleic acid-binding protein [Patescibacteria group bacterium]
METVTTIQTIVKTIVDLMVNNATVEVQEDAGIFKVFIQAGEEAPAIIGRHGDTIRSLQKVLEVACFNKLQTRIDLVVNVNDYREKQIERLQNIAAEIAEKVRNGGRALPFRGLNSYERRIVHEFITKNYTNLNTYSVGEGRFRELMIDLQSASPVTYNESNVPDENSTTA